MWFQNQDFCILKMESYGNMGMPSGQTYPKGWVKIILSIIITVTKELKVIYRLVKYCWHFGELHGHFGTQLV